MDSSYQLSRRELAHQLVEDLLSNPSTSLAGVDALTKKYRASRLTVKRALGHLEDLGVIAPSERGKKRQVNLSKLHRIASLQDSGTPRNRIVFLTECPESNSAYLTRYLYEVFHRLCDQSALLLTYLQVPSKEAELQALLNACQPKGVILYDVAPQMSEVVESMDVPAIQIGGQQKRRLPRFYTSYDALLAQAFRHAVDAGHCRIAAPMIHAKAPYYEDLASRLEPSLFGIMSSFSRRYNFPLVAGPSVEDYHETLRELLRYTPPTCLILHDLPEYHMASSFFMKQRMRIPDEVSIIVLSHDPAFGMIVPSIAHFVLFSEADAIDAFKVLKDEMNGFQSVGATELTPLWVPGESLTPPKPK